MSGNDEIPTLQCPVCKRNNSRTVRWAAFVGAGQIKNWCWFELDTDQKMRILYKFDLSERSALLKIDRIKCSPQGLTCMRHVFYPDDPIFERVKAAILNEDKRVQRMEGTWRDE